MSVRHTDLLQKKCAYDLPERIRDRQFIGLAKGALRPLREKHYKHQTQTKTTKT